MLKAAEGDIVGIAVGNVSDLSLKSCPVSNRRSLRSVVFRVLAGILAVAGGATLALPLHDFAWGDMGFIVVVALGGYAVLGERTAYKILAVFGVREPTRLREPIHVIAKDRSANLGATSPDAPLDRGGG